MNSNNLSHSVEGFVVPGTIAVSPSALEMAKNFYDVVKGNQGKDWVVTFDWAESITVRRGPREPAEDIGACLTLGAYERSQIPRGVTETVDGTEFAIKIPMEVWRKSARRLIDLDEKLLFKLALR